MFDFQIKQVSDPNIAGTLLGIAVKVQGHWRVYNKERQEITDLGEVQIGGFPLYLVPAMQINPGDVIVDNGKYYCVINRKNRIQTVNIGTGRSHSIVPIKNALGMSIYQKVISMSDLIAQFPGFRGSIL